MAKSKKKRKKKNSSEHDTLYTVCLLTGLIGPIVVYLALMLAVFGAPNSPWLILGLVGAFAIGAGMASVVSSVFWKLPIGVLGIVPSGIGAILILVSSLLMFSPSLKMLFDMEMVSYCFVTIGFLAFSAVFYMIFRFAVDSRLKMSYGLSNTRIRKLKKGKKNYWWYEALHREVGLGILYGMNKLYTLVFTAALILTVVGGYFRFFSILICALMTTLGLLGALMAAFALAQNHKEEHGRYVVLFAQNSRKGIDCILFDLFAVLMLLVMAYAHMILTADLWGIELPHL